MTHSYNLQIYIIIVIVIIWPVRESRERGVVRCLTDDIDEREKNAPSSETNAVRDISDHNDGDRHGDVGPRRYTPAAGRGPAERGCRKRTLHLLGRRLPDIVLRHAAAMNWRNSAFFSSLFLTSCSVRFSAASTVDEFTTSNGHCYNYIYIYGIVYEAIRPRFLR